MPKSVIPKEIDLGYSAISF